MDLTISNVSKFVHARLRGDIVIQQRRANYIVVNTPLLDEKVLNCFDTLSEQLSADVTFCKDNLCHVVKGGTYKWPSRKLSKTVRGAVRRMVKSTTVSESAFDMVVRCMEIICQFDSVHFVPALTTSDHLSWTNLSVNLHELHVVDIQFLRSKMSGAVIDISFISGTLHLKLRRGYSGIQRGRDDEKTKTTKKIQ